MAKVEDPMFSKIEIGQLVRLFDRGGYVLDFTTDDFDNFTLSSVGVPVCTKYGLSKAKSLKAFLNEADSSDVRKLLLDLFEYYEANFACEFEDWDEFPKPCYASRDNRGVYKICKKAVDRERAALSPLDQTAKYLKQEFSSEYMNEQIELLVRMRTEHPTDAIGKSKEVLESCCKTILSRQGIAIDPDWQMPQLCKRTAKLLKVDASDVDPSGPQGKIVKKILGSLQGLATGVYEFRNRYGDGHGRDATFKPLPARHAKLAVGSCMTLVEYYWETYEWRRGQGLLK